MCRLCVFGLDQACSEEIQRQKPGIPNRGERSLLSLVAASAAHLVAASIIHYQWAGVLVLVCLCVDHSLLDVPVMIERKIGGTKKERVSLLIIPYD